MPHQVAFSFAALAFVRLCEALTPWITKGHAHELHFSDLFGEAVALLVTAHTPFDCNAFTRIQQQRKCIVEA